MKEKVLVKIRSTQTPVDQGETSVIEQSLPGELVAVEGRYTLRYTEYQEGFSEPVTNLIRLSEEGMSVKKTGCIDTVMEIEPGRIWRTLYRVPFGSFHMELAGSTYRLTKEPEGFKAEAGYRLFLDGAAFSDCRILIDVKRAMER